MLGESKGFHQMFLFSNPLQLSQLFKNSFIYSVSHVSGTVKDTVYITIKKIHTTHALMGLTV